MLKFLTNYPLEVYLKNLLKFGNTKRGNPLSWYLGVDRTMYMVLDQTTGKILGWNGNANSISGGPNQDVLRDNGNLPNVHVAGPYPREVIQKYQTGNNNEITVVAELSETILVQLPTDHPKFQGKNPRQLKAAITDKPAEYILGWKNFDNAMEYDWELLDTKLELLDAVPHKTLPKKIIAVGVPKNRVKNAARWVEQEKNVLVKFLPASLVALKWAFLNAPKEKFLFFYASSAECIKAFIDPEMGVVDLRHESRSGAGLTDEDGAEIESMLEEYGDVIQNPQIWAWGADPTTHTFEQLKNKWKKLRAITPEELMRGEPLRIENNSSGFVDEAEAWLVLQSLK
jgi:hypothetical protein